MEISIHSSCCKQSFRFSICFVVKILAMLQIAYAKVDEHLIGNAIVNCSNYCQIFPEYASPNVDLITPNCTEHCTHSVYSCPEGYVSIQTPVPYCRPFTICDGTNPCHYGTCSPVDNGYNFTCFCFDGYYNNGSKSTPCYPEAKDDCTTMGCEHDCNYTSNVPQCSCLPGFQLDNNNVSCTFDNSSSFIPCEFNCSHGVCLNDSCHCFACYLPNQNGTCDVKEELNEELLSNCSGNDSFHNNSRNNGTCDCAPGFTSANGSCEQINPCDNSTIRNSCEMHGMRCRPKPIGDYECYCGLPYYPVQGLVNNINFCIPPVTTYFVYNLSLELIGYYEDDTYTVLRQFESLFYRKFFPNIINGSVLNLEITSFNSNISSSLSELSLLVSLDEEVAYFGELIANICSVYPYSQYEDACILPGNIVIRRSTVNYTSFDDICELDEDISGFLCGKTANCNSNKGRYECACMDGYQMEMYLNPMKPSCIDVDECLEFPCKGANQMCINEVGNYSCMCIPCYVWNEAQTDCVSLCDPNPCNHGGICILNEIQDTCGFQCVCKEEHKGPMCSEINDAVRVAQTNVAITGGVLGAILGLTIIVGLFVIYKILKRTGYFSFRASKTTLT